MSKVHRIYVEKRKEFAVEALELLHNLQNQLKIKNLESVKVINRYDVQGVSQDALNQGISIILSEPMVDDVVLEDYENPNNYHVFGIEYLPGQYDQRADACEQCFQLLTGEKKVTVKCAKIIVLVGNVSDNDAQKIKKYLIIPVDQREASLDKVDTLESEEVIINKVPVIEGFIDFTKEELINYLKENSMAMNYDDLKVTQDYFKDEEHRNPTETELKVLDTYWSDHCRHTTFSTIITDLNIAEGEFKEVLRSDIEKYISSRHAVYGINTTRPMTLMDLATISMKELRKQGFLDDLEVSEEINACSIEIEINTTNGKENWLLMFKNETHNHPTEIEPFGGAATCLGGAIRDPLSGRAYVYQSMRITGAGDPREKLEDTLKGNLPHIKIC